MEADRPEDGPVVGDAVEGVARVAEDDVVAIDRDFFCFFFFAGRIVSFCFGEGAKQGEQAEG